MASSDFLELVPLFSLCVCVCICTGAHTHMCACMCKRVCGVGCSSGHVLLLLINE